MIDALSKYLTKLSDGKFSVKGKVQEFGCVALRDYQECTTSPDGVFPLLKKNISGEQDFIGLSALEMKTNGTDGTIDTVIEDTLKCGAFEQVRNCQRNT